MSRHVKAWLEARHAANVAKANPWLPGHSCHTTKGAEMTSDPPSSDSQPLAGEKGTEVRPCDSEALTEALARIERLKDLVCDREDTIIERDATIERMTYERSHPFGEAIQEADDRRAL